MFPQIRLPGDVSDDVDEDPTGNKALWDRGLLNGASQKVSLYLLLSFEEEKNPFVKFYTILKKAIKVLSILAKHRKCFDLYILLNRHIPLCFYRH